MDNKSEQSSLSAVLKVHGSLFAHLGCAGHDEAGEAGSSARVAPNVA